MMTISTITPITSPQCRDSGIAACISRSIATNALAGCVAKHLGAINHSGRGAERNVDELTGRDLSESAEPKPKPAYSLTVEKDECYFVRGNDGRAYLVANSSHGSDAFGLAAVAYKPPQPHAPKPAFHAIPTVSHFGR
jgi:hypothetical protein